MAKLDTDTFYIILEYVLNNVRLYKYEITYLNFYSLYVSVTFSRWIWLRVLMQGRKNVNVLRKVSHEPNTG